MPIFSRDADLYTFPKLINSLLSTHVSLGDLHGNALKLIYVMIEEGVLELKDEQDGATALAKYTILRDIYCKPVDCLAKHDLDLFEEIINTASIHVNKAVTLIGDELADRGNNDYFTLLVLKKLKEAGVNIDILLSNHSVEFISENVNNFTGYPTIFGEDQSYSKSYCNIKTLIDNGLLDVKKVQEIVRTCYQPILKAINYTLSQEGFITLFSHAPIGLETLKALADTFQINYDDSSQLMLIHTIDEINVVIQTLLKTGQLKSSLIPQFYGNDMMPIPPKTHPLYRLIWNRALGRELITEPTGKFTINFVHGHVNYRGTIKADGVHSLPNHENIDSIFGMPDIVKSGYSELCNVDVAHFTRQSADFTANVLTTQIIVDISKKWLERRNQDQKVQEIQQIQQIQHCQEVIQWNYGVFNRLLTELNTKTGELIAKGTNGGPLFDSKYEDAGRAAKQLMVTLRRAGDAFFYKKDISQEDYDQFKKTCEVAIKDAERPLSTHRSRWSTVPPMLNGLFSGAAILPVSPTSTAAGLSKGFFQSMLGNTSPTKSIVQLLAFKEGLKETIYFSIQHQLDLKAQANAELKLLESKSKLVLELDLQETSALAP